MPCKPMPNQGIRTSEGKGTSTQAGHKKQKQFVSGLDAPPHGQWRWSRLHVPCTLARIVASGLGRGQPNIVHGLPHYRYVLQHKYPTKRDQYFTKANLCV